MLVKSLVKKFQYSEILLFFIENFARYKTQQSCMSDVFFLIWSVRKLRMFRNALTKHPHENNFTLESSL